MTAAAEPSRMTYAEYRDGELAAEVKHEYLRGEVFAMTGGTPQHSALAARITALLSRELGGRPCRVSDDDHAIVNPSLLVEVLSSSTEAYDRGQKAAHYRRIPSLRAYLLVSQHEPHLELFIRRDDGTWSLLEAEVDQRLRIEPLGEGA